MISELPVRSKCNYLSYFILFFVLALGAVAYEVRSSINARDHSSLVLRTLEEQRRRSEWVQARLWDGKGQ